MPHVCPKSCGRLVTAAILIAVGVVQLIAGLILVKSKYVYLLAAPDFWTAVSNFAVGGLLGVSASVWREIGKMSSKHTTRRNILCALMFSCLMINATTAAILIMGEGNALLSIQLETGGVYSTLSSELLAYAYATSVCSPIICIVISCVYMSGLCFRRRKSIESSKTEKVLGENDSYSYNWVFKSKLRDQPKPDPDIIRRALSSKYLSSTSSDDDSYCSSESMQPSRSNSVPSIDGMEDSLQTSILRSKARSESNLFHQQRLDPKETVDGRSLPRIGNRMASVKYEAREVSKKEVLLSLPRNFNRDFGNKSRHYDLDKGLSTAEDVPDCSVNSRNSKWTIQSEVATFANPNVEDFEGYEKSQFGHFSQRSPFKRQYPAKHKTVRQSIITADVHLNANKLEDDHGYTNHSFSPEEPALDYDTSPKHAYEENSDSRYTNRKVYRTSTAKGFKSDAADETAKRHPVVRRTYNPVSSDLPEDCSVIEKWQGRSLLEKSLSNRGASLQRQSFAEVPQSSKERHSLEQHKNPSEEVDESFDAVPTDYFAGEVVPIRVSTLPRKMSAKLIPVAIPAVAASSRRYTLKSAEISNNKKFKNMPENQRRGTSLVKANKFDRNSEPKLLSFHGGVKAKDYRNRRIRASIPHAILSDPPDAPTSSFTEYRGRSCPASPAHTSGYMSALEETLNEAAENTAQEDSLVSGQESQDPTSSQNTWKPSEMVKETMTKIIEESPIMKSKKEIIDQLLNDPAFQKMVKQTLKETEI